MSNHKNQLIIPVYWMEDEAGNKIYDVEYMREEFEDELNKLTGGTEDE